MAWTKYQFFLAGMMIVTGSINTLSTKWADNTSSQGRDGVFRLFDHPFLQAVGMFLGELSCLFVYHVMRCHRSRQGREIEGNTDFNPLVFLPAALLDMCGTSTMYIGLNLTFASSFQMLRGAVMIFTALLSVIFLRRIIHQFQWLGMGIVFCGLVLVGVADIVFGNNDTHDKNGIIAGDLLIIMAQVITAAQMVYEEKFVNKHNVHPLQAVGWEGFFGFFVLGVLLIPMYFIKAGRPFSQDPDGRLENALDAFEQMKNNHIIVIATVGNILSIAFFNFAGISVTKELSATTRMVLDSCRTVVIWIVSLSVKWQVFQVTSFIVQAAGFTLLICGMCVYNDIVCAPFLRHRGCLSPLPEDFEPVVSRKEPDIQDVADVHTPLLRNAASPTSSYDAQYSPAIF